jgi:hypothetical protein
MNEARKAVVIPSHPSFFQPCFQTVDFRCSRRTTTIPKLARAFRSTLVERPDRSRCGLLRRRPIQVNSALRDNVGGKRLRHYLSVPSKPTSERYEPLGMVLLPSCLALILRMNYAILVGIFFLVETGPNVIPKARFCA